MSDDHKKSDLQKQESRTIMNLNVLQNLLTPTQGVNQRHPAHTKTDGKIMLVEGPLGDFGKEMRSEKGENSFSSDDDVSTLSGNTSCSSWTSSGPSSPRRAHFNAAVSQRLIPCINEYSREEIERTWYLPEESFKIHQRCVKEVIMLETGMRLKGKKYCSRGLENSTMRAQLAKKKNRRYAYDAVLDEQDEQQEHDDYDDEAIAEMYHEASMSCQLWAHVVGMQDRREAELIYYEDE
jgi:hypothetical protein